MATTADRRDHRETKIFSATTADAGAVHIAFPAGAAFPVGGIAVNSSDAGSVWSTGVSSLRSTGSGAAIRGGCMVTTVRSGSVAVDGSVRNVDTSRAGSVKISLTATQAAPATAGANGQEGAKVSRMVAATAATALDLLDVVHSTAHGEKLHAFLAFLAGAANMHARGAIGGLIILFASLAMLLVGIAVKRADWI